MKYLRYDVYLDGTMMDSFISNCIITFEIPDLDAYNGIVNEFDWETYDKDNSPFVEFSWRRILPHIKGSNTIRESGTYELLTTSGHTPKNKTTVVVSEASELDTERYMAMINILNAYRKNKEALTSIAYQLLERAR